MVDAGGVPLAATLTGANRHDVTQLLPLVDAIPPVRGRPGAPLRKPGEVMGDRALRLRPAPHAAVGPGHRARPSPAAATRHGSGLGVFRYVVEQTIALLHQFRRLRTRFDKRDDVHETFMTIGEAMICWRRLHSSEGYF